MKKLFKTIRAAALGLLVLGTASCCLKDIPVTGLSLSQTSLTLIEGEEAHLTVTVTPADATDPGVVWRSSDASVATVNDGLVKAVAPGTATITVSTPDGLQTASCIVTVNRQAVPVASVSLDKTSLEMTVGDEATLTATVAPADADVKTVSWSSSDEGVATVADGKVTAVGAGSATITVTTTDGGKTATCAVTVAAPQPKELAFVKMEAERLPDMLTPRADFVLYPMANGEILAAGGHTTGFSPTSSAEYYKDGTWTALDDMTARHDMPFSVELPDGRLLIGGGCSSGGGVGQSASVDAFDPAGKTFSSFAPMFSERALTRAVAVGKNVLVSGNWYAGDGLEMWTEGADAFTSVKGVSQGRHFPYMFQTSADNAIIFGSYDTHGSNLSEIIVDRYQGDPFTPELFGDWRPAGVGANWRAADCAVGEYTYLLMLSRADVHNNRGGAVALLQGEDISLLPTDYEIPDRCEFGDIYFAGPVVADRSKSVAYAFGFNGDNANAVYYILKIEYADALNGGKAKLTMYYSDVLETFGGAYQGGIALMSDGRLMAAGGITNSNYSPYSTVYAFKPF